MRLKKNRHRIFPKAPRKLYCKNLQFNQCQVVDHFVREGIAWQKVYNALNRRKNGQSVLCPPLSWTSSMNVKFKRLVNNQIGVSQPKLNKNFYKNQTSICRQIQKISINN